MNPSPTPQPQRNARTALSLAAIVVGMVMLAYASAPLYRMFCQVTGFAGTPMKAQTASTVTVDRQVVVRFNADTAPNLPWKFSAQQASVSVNVGENKLAFFAAQNHGEAPVVGTATFNVTPEKAAKYFAKVQCFCFEQQVLNPGQAMDFPVSFYIDPRFAADDDMKDVHTITLSYTFFLDKDQSKLNETSASNGTEPLPPT